MVVLLRNEDRCSLNPAPPDPWGPGNDGRRFTLTVAPRGPRYPPSDHSAVEPCHRKPGTLVAGSVDLAGLALRLDSLLRTRVSPLQCQGKRGAMATCIPRRGQPLAAGQLRTVPMRTVPFATEQRHAHGDCTSEGGRTPFREARERGDSGINQCAAYPSREAQRRLRGPLARSLRRTGCLRCERSKRCDGRSCSRISRCPPP